MENAKKWSVKDVITLVLMTVLLIVIQLGINMICMVNDFVSMVLSVGITMVVCGPVYFLMVNRIHKRFVSLVYMTLLGLVFLIMGNWFLLPWFIVVGILAELILWKEITPNRLTAAWTVSSLAVASGMEQSYIDAYVQYYTTPGWVIFILIFTMLCGFLGSLVGRKLIQKHFKKAGVL